MLLDSTIDELLTIRYADLQRFSQASPRLRRFLNETEYDLATGSYIRNGQLVPNAEIKQILELEQQRVTRQFEDATTEYLDGDITVEEWERRIIDEQKTAGIIAVLFALGGIAFLMSNRNRGVILRGVGDRLRASGKGVSGFGTLLSNGDRSPKRLKAYVRYKARDIRPTFNSVAHEGRKLAGYNEGRRFLDPSVVKHCESCPGYERREWVPIDEIVPVGVDCECAGRCKCWVQYRFNLNREGPLRAIRNTNSLNQQFFN